MTNELVLSEDLRLPLDAVTQTFGFIGRKGAGKTYAAGKLVEELFDRGAPVVVLDPVGNWWGLRMASDGKGEGLPIPIFGGDHGDLPLHADSGRIVASTLLAWKHCSAVLDVSSFRKNERERFVADFAEEFFHEAKKIRRPVMIVLEEAQKFCLTPDTEVLTYKGWKPLPEVRKRDEIVCYDMKKDTYDYEIVEDVVKMKFDGELVHFKTTSIDCLMTPEHRAVIQRFQHDPKRYKRYPTTFCAASEVPSQFIVPIGGSPTARHDLSISNDLLRLIGWLIADGYIHQKSRSTKDLGLEQSTRTRKMGKKIADEMRKVLTRLGCAGEYKRGPRGRTGSSIQFYLGRNLSKRVWAEFDGGTDLHRIPRYLMEGCSRRQLELLMTALLEGDGTSKDGKTWTRFYAGKNEPLADDFQELLTKLGIRNLKKKVPQNGQWIVSLSQTPYHWIRRRKKGVHYVGDVHCLTVPSGAFVARRNGTVFVTGNCPQHSRGSERIVGAIEDIVRLGRNYGIGAALLSQRPQSVNKEVLNQVECLLVGQLAGKHERKAIEDWIVEKDIDVSASELPKLRVGEMFVWSPQWLGIFKKIRIAKKRTYDASETPKLGAVRGGVKLAKLDIESLRKNMEAMIERANENDPTALRAKVASLEAKLRAKGSSSDGLADLADHNNLKRIVASEIEEAQKHIRTAGALTEYLDEAFKVLVRSVTRLTSDGHPRITASEIKEAQKRIILELRTGSPRHSTPDSRLSTSPNGLKRGMREMLCVLAATGPLTKTNLAVLSVISPTSGSYSTYLSVLKTRGYIVQNDNTGCIERIPPPAGQADEFPRPAEGGLSRDVLIDKWSKKLGSIGKAGTRRMFEVLVENYPHEMPRKELAIRSDMNQSGSFSTYLSILRTNRLIEEVGSRKQIRLTKAFDIAQEGRGA